MSLKFFAIWTLSVNSWKVCGSPQQKLAGATITDGERRSKSRIDLSEMMTVVIAFDGSRTKVQILHPTGIVGMA